MDKKRLVNIEGRSADFGKLDDYGQWTATVVGGPRDSHEVTVMEEKHNCGAHGITVKCSCGVQFQTAMNGCWQQGHQRPKKGDLELEKMLTTEYGR